jgi:3'(2'), 5'-bisphosphate nucleotidase
MIISRSHAARELVQLEALGEHVAGTVVAGSSLKFCRIAEGAADIYPRFGPTMEWDTAAGHGVLLAAGGAVARPDGRPLGYGKPGFLNPHFIARGRR